MRLSSRYLRSFEADLQTRSSLAQCRLAITTEPLHSEVEAPHAAQPSGAVDPVSLTWNGFAANLGEL